MGVNNISHYNYSHTATPIHHQPSSTPPSLSSSLHFPSVFTPNLLGSLPLLYDLITPFTLFSLTHFLFLSILGDVNFLFTDYIELNLLVSGLIDLKLE